ncbi:hypothetical protein NL676_018508 [Syzygium grande]|nr:hypothetical protein NL676_018508 [Syzygium grande]
MLSKVMLGESQFGAAERSTAKGSSLSGSIKSALVLNESSLHWIAVAGEVQHQSSRSRLKEQQQISNEGTPWSSSCTSGLMMAFRDATAGRSSINWWMSVLGGMRSTAAEKERDRELEVLFLWHFLPLLNAQAFCLLRQVEPFKGKVREIQR